MRNYFCQGGEKADVIMIVYRKNIIYIRTHLGIYSLLLIHSKIEYFTFAFVMSKKKKIYKIYISLMFLRPVATVTDKLLRDSPYHGVRIPIIARFQSIPLIVYDYANKLSNMPPVTESPSVSKRI